MNVIMGGSEVSGITYSATRRHARVTVNPETNCPLSSSYTATDQIINFVDNEATGLINPHHDTFFISLLITNCRIKRVLINNGSSTNVLFLNALRELKIDEANIQSRSTILVGFNGDQKFTVKPQNKHLVNKP